jgi:mannose-6-phosphate isomerase-like protein (cupin superfamily)
MDPYLDDIEHVTENNLDYRRVVFTGRHLQLVLMSLAPGEEIGEETHDGDQFIRFEEGEGTVVIDGVERSVRDDWAVVIPAGTRHNVVNTGGEDLKFYTIYAPPEHRDGLVQPTKAHLESGAGPGGEGGSIR